MSRVPALVKAFMGKKTKARLRRAVRSGRYFVLQVFNRFPFLGRVYVVFFTKNYDKEIQAVIAGQVAHVKNKQGQELVNYHLRRSIHRLEKGLSMQPFRSVFGLDIIGSTVTSYEKTCQQTPFAESTDLQWAHDVLKAYFQVCAPHPIILEARARFEATGAPPELEQSRPLTPFNRSESPELTVTYEQLHQLAVRRRSVRWYQQRPVERQLIDDAIKLASLSPSACNRQPFQFRVIDDPVLLRKCRKLPMGVRGFAENIPVLVAVVGALRAYSEPRDRHAIYVDGALAAMSFMFAVETLGLASCPINWPDIPARDQQAEKVLGLSKDQRIILWISLGYADSAGKIPCSAKIDLDVIRKFN